jgi:hypothetical protein
MNRDEIEKRHFDAAQPFYPLGFSVSHRNPGHWDIWAPGQPGRAAAWLEAHPGASTSERDGQRVRAFRIRGCPGNVLVADERWNPHRPRPAPGEGWRRFTTIAQAMTWIAGELMQEPAQPHAAQADSDSDLECNEDKS